MKWYRRITSKAEGDFTALGEALEWYEDELVEARKDIAPKGRLWQASQKLPGMMEYRWGQLQELEAILEFLDILTDKALHKWRRHYTENHQRAMSDRNIEKWAEAENEVIDLKLLKNEVVLVRNKYLGVTKALETLHYQITNLTRLKVAGMEDAVL